MKEDTYTLVLKRSELDVIMRALSERPYGEVFGAVRSIQEQTQSAVEVNKRTAS